MTSNEKYREIVDAVGEQEAERLIICELGSIEATHDHLVAQRVICPLGGCAGSMGCACSC